MLPYSLPLPIFETKSEPQDSTTNPQQPQPQPQPQPQQPQQQQHPTTSSCSATSATLGFFDDASLLFGDAGDLMGDPFGLPSFGDALLVDMYNVTLPGGATASTATTTTTTTTAPLNTALHHHHAAAAAAAAACGALERQQDFSLFEDIPCWL